MGYLEDQPLHEHGEESQQNNPRRTRPLPSQDEPEEATTATPGDFPDQVNPGWRSRRRDYRARRRRSPSSSPQELQLWLQQGGWIYIAAGAFLFVAALVGVLIVTRSSQSQAGQQQPAASGLTSQPQREPSLPGLTLTPLPSVTPIPTPPPPTAPPTPQKFVVVGTSGLGLFLRDNPSTNSTVLETLPDGTVVERVGEDDVPGADHVWRKVRSPEGQEGWVAVDYLQPAP